MADKSGIEYTDATWNVGAGCSAISESCDNCWACRLAATRLKHHPRYAGLAEMVEGRPQWTGEVRVFPDRLDQPLHWKRPRTVFVGSQFDLFRVPTTWAFVSRAFEVIEECRRHTFLLLTKRPIAARDFLRIYEIELQDNVWLGITAENQRWLNKRWEVLRLVPGHKWLSLEPLLGPIDIWNCLHTSPGACAEAVILGGESGPGARLIHPYWVRSVRDQCAAAGVPFFLKQLGSAWAKQNKAKSRHGADSSEWPEDLRVQELPWRTGGQSIVSSE